MPTVVYTEGNDTVSHSTATSDTLIFIGGNDRLNVFDGTVQAFMGEGDDFIDLRGGTSTVYGESGADRFEVNATATLFGGGDNDLFSLRGGSGVEADGGEGDDRFNFGAALTGVLLHGGAGEEDFSGYDYASTGSIYGDSGNDRFTGFQAGMTLYGGGGNDVYRVNPGSNGAFVELVDDGKDTVQVMRGTDFTLADNIENLVVGTYIGADTTSATVTGNGLDNAMTGHGNDETINGLAGNDRLFGKGGTDTLNGGDGNDILDGGSGDDTLNGGSGNDRLNGRTGNDTMNGGTGDDIYYVDSGADVVTEGSGEGADTIRTTTDIFALAANVENGVIEGSAGLNLWGNALNNLLIGNAGADTLFGDSGNDDLRGLGGNDGLYGGFGDDTLSGGTGDDYLWGYFGADSLFGGAGVDTFDFNEVGESAPGSADRIEDLHSQSGASVDDDILDLSSIDADVTTAGDQAFFFSGFSPTGTAGEFWATTDGDDQTLHFDINGDSISDMDIILVGRAVDGIYFDDMIL